MDLKLTLRRRELRQNAAGHTIWALNEDVRHWSAEKTALLLCDVWDKHWSRGAVERLEPMLPRMQQVVETLRAQGVQMIHAPSDTMDFYAGSEARLRAQQAPQTEVPADIEHADPPLPIDASDEGSDTAGDVPARVWNRQHPAIGIDEECDIVTDRGAEVYSYLRYRGIEHVLIMGVHTNMCVLHRSFAIKQMVRWGIDIALLRDLTDTMYNPAMPPYVEHDEGTRLVVEFIEKFWCASVESREILGG